MAGNLAGEVECGWPAIRRFLAGLPVRTSSRPDNLSGGPKSLLGVQWPGSVSWRPYTRRPWLEPLVLRREHPTAIGTTSWPSEGNQPIVDVRRKGFQRSHSQAVSGFRGDPAGNQSAFRQRIVPGNSSSRDDVRRVAG